MEIPPLFLQRMQNLMGADFAAFAGSLSQPARLGLRANTLKISPEALQRRLPFQLAALPGIPGGFLLEEGGGENRAYSPGRHPYHAAGLYYLQEPSAMAAAQLLAPQPGERILDLCAAPGGKSTHLAALLGDQGLLVANETHPRRAWELAENLERWGTRQAVATQETPERLADHFGAAFDRVLVDAPCSGEGMFRKGDVARQEWSPELAHSCSLRQTSILDSAVRLVKPGGWLGYSTCTFNPAENEGQIARLVQKFPDFELVDLQALPGAAPGRPDWLSEKPAIPGLAKTLRLWPHLSPGEGHFVALLRRGVGVISVGGTPGIKPTHRSTHPHARRSHLTGMVPAPALKAWEQFAQETLSPSLQPWLNDPHRLHLVGSYLYRLPDLGLDLGSLHTIHPGWWLGTVKMGQTSRQGRCEPSHALALGLRAGDCLRQIGFEAGDPDLLAYLRGEALRRPLADGWTLVKVDEFPIGWGKCSQGVLKNYYPRGLRWL